jgi:hypothetical protein
MFEGLLPSATVAGGISRLVTGFVGFFLGRLTRRGLPNALPPLRRQNLREELGALTAFWAIVISARGTLLKAFCISDRSAERARSYISLREDAQKVALAIKSMRCESTEACPPANTCAVAAHRAFGRMPIRLRKEPTFARPSTLRRRSKVIFKG